MILLVLSALAVQAIAQPVYIGDERETLVVHAANSFDWNEMEPIYQKTGRDSESATTTGSDRSLSCKCGGPFSFQYSRIINGFFVPANSIPFQVRLFIPSQGYPSGYFTPFCGGSIISPNYILTAAHCLTSINTTGLSVYVGGSDFSTGLNINYLIPVQSFIIHPSWNPNGNMGFPYDYAILKLSLTLNINHPLVGVVCLPPDETQTFVGANLTATGWGLTASGDSNPAWESSGTKALKGTFLTGISKEECSKSFGSMIGLYHICASGAANKSSVCKGDSGGPLAAFVNGKVVVVGISSFVRGNCSLGYPNVFSRVTFQKSWILSNTDAGAYQCLNVTDGAWGAWSSFSTCTKTCGNGTWTRSRLCNNPSPATNGGLPCPGNSTETQYCATQACPINGNWSNWSAFTTCTKTCGVGTQSHTRTCTNPAPANGGLTCLGLGSETIFCNTQTCIINGNWSEWSAFTTCTKTCGGGNQTHTRTCTNPAPANGGLACSGFSSENLPCNTQFCSVPAYTKLLITNGFGTGLSGTDTELLDFSSAPTATCTPPPSFPFYTASPVSGLGYQNEPLICGENRTCVSYTLSSRTWNAYSFIMNSARQSPHFAFNPSIIGSGRIVAAGGYNLSSIEYLTPTGWVQSTAKLPVPSHYGCMVAINSSTVMIIEGLDFSVISYSKKTYFFNHQTNSLTNGPPLLQGRYSFGCGSMKDPITGTISIVVAGGTSNVQLNSTEILDLATGVWKNGPNLPMPLQNPKIVPHPQVGVIILGGISWQPTGSSYPKSVYYLSSSTASAWTLLPQTMKNGRASFTAMYIPDTSVTCTGTIG